MTSSKRLRCDISMYSVDTMPHFADKTVEQKLAEIVAAGYEGVQFSDVTPAATIALARSHNLAVTQSGRISVPSDADRLAAIFAECGAECATIHLGWGLEDEDEGARLIEALLTASQKHGVPLYAETHRATLLQDPWRTVQFLEKFPGLFLNADFSHWYTGGEMVYGDFDSKLRFLAPAFARVRYVHGRISDPGCMEACVFEDREQSFVQHFRQMWTLAFEGFLRHADEGSTLCFVPELLGPEIFYARTYPGASGQRIEECDRWPQSHLHAKIAKECFAAAQTALK